MKPYVYTGKVVKIIDGDTVDVLVDLGFSITTKIRFRLNGIDTAEKNSSNIALKTLAKEAKAFLETRILNKSVILNSYAPDKYGRYLADIFVANEDKSINSLLIEADLAKIYNGGSKEHLWESPIN